MEKPFLQLFLETGLFDIGDNDTRLENLESAIKDVQEKLSKNHKLLPTYTLVALDPNVSENEQALVDTEAIVTTYWKALRTKYSERPIHILRGVILNALYTIGKADPKLARIIVLTATNFYPYASLNKEISVIHKWLTELSELAEKKAVETWALTSTTPELKISNLELSGLNFGNIEIDVEDLKEKIASATTGSGYNSSSTQWGQHLGNGAGTAIAKTIENALNEFSESLTPESIEGPINKYFAGFKKSLDSVLKTSFDAIKAVDQRSKLIWWKETLYSTALKRGYREIDKMLQPIMMAYDLYILLPSITPVSVDYLLKDTLRLVNPDLDNDITFKELLDGIDGQEIKLLYRPYFQNKDDIGGRISITDFVYHLANDKVKVNDFYSRTGIDLNRKTSLAYFTVSILHDLMAVYLIK
ncbi:hypothetical protein GCM10027592_62990 [Spirosoma flavus]